MNFFKLYIGDYQRDTGTLSLAEHGAYLLMMQNAYATEAPLPVGRELYRLLRAETKIERDAVDAVATKFWVNDGAGLINPRVTEEIAKAQHQRTVNREVGKRGGRPKRAETKPNDNRIGFDSVTDQEPNDNPNHSHSQSNTPIPGEDDPGGVVVIPWGGRA